MKYFFAWALIATSLFANSQTKNHLNGQIKGTVTDQSGSPVVGATVYAVPQFLAFDGIKPRSVKTDWNGEFDFRGGFQLGAYKLYSQKGEDGYPDPFKSFYADSKFEVPKVVLTKAHSSATVKVILGKKAGVVAGQVIDADSGAATKAFLVFIDEDGNRREILADGPFRVLLPTGKDLILMVTATSRHASTQRPFDTPVRLEPGQEIYMDIPVSQQ
jgi:Carboxypeptidase regulatory-like domain